MFVTGGVSATNGMQGLTMNFGDNFYYSFPFLNEVNDGDKFYCYVSVEQRMDNVNQIEVGYPFFESFQATFDTQNAKIGLALLKNVFGTITQK